MTAVIGISAFYHDSAACLVVDGRIVAAAQEERFSRRRHDSSFPTRALAWCMAHAGLEPSDLAVAAFYDKPFLKFERVAAAVLSAAPRGLRAFVEGMPSWASTKLHLRDLLRTSLPGFRGELAFFEHHESHAASAFLPSPFRQAAILTVDGVGEWTTTSQGRGLDASVVLDREIRYPHSLGLLYSAFTAYCGFRVNSGEYKLMGLAPYGEPRFVELIREHLIDLRPDGSYRLDLRFFDFGAGCRMTTSRFDRLMGGPPREPESPFEPRFADLARSVQQVLEEAVLAQARDLHRRSGERHLVMAGGCALNCVANARLLREGPFEDVWVQPAAGDAGGAVGAALLAWHRVLGEPRQVVAGSDAMRGAFLGPQYSDAQVADFLAHHGLSARTLPEEELAIETARRLARGEVVGWFQGPMEFGPRALGGRSILADPRRRAMRQRLNLTTKHREAFRPFAPAVLAEKASAWFATTRPSPYMLFTAPVRATRPVRAGDGPSCLPGLDRPGALTSELPAVTHVDGSARLQTVHADTSPRFHRLIRAFGAETGVDVVVNTSFNVRGEPIVAGPEDAWRCFQGTDMDALVLGSSLLVKGAAGVARAT